MTRPLLIIFLTIFVNLIGFGIIIPLLPFYAQTFGASPLEQHLGLGKSARIDDLEIWWPATNTYQHFTGVQKNQALVVTEFASDYRVLERTPVHLGGGKRVP